MTSGKVGSTLPCSTEGCDSLSKARGLCGPHYAQLRRTLAVCSVGDCGKPAKTRGWCAMHYERWRVHGDLTYTTVIAICTVEGCEKAHSAGGYCQMHWTRLQRYGDVGTVAASRVLRYMPGTVCAVEGCEASVRNRGWCSLHYARWQNHGDPTVVLFPKAERVADCIVCGKPTAHGHRQFCSSACQAFVSRSGVRSRDTCKTCDDLLPVVLTEAGNRRRGNGHGYCLSCADVAPCAQCGEPRKRSGSSLVCRPCRRPAAVADAQVRRARLLDAICEHGDGCVTAGVIKAIRAGECAYCASPAEHVDHFMPLARGGAHCIDNLVPACADCNLSKSDADPWTWIAGREVAS